MKRASIAIALVLTACPAKTPVVTPDPEPSRSSSAAPSPEPSPSTKAPKALRAAYIGDDGLYLYDVSADTVLQLLSGTGIRQPRFLNRDTIAFVRDEGAGSSVMSFNTRTRALTTLHTSNAPINAWAPRADNQEIAYVVTDSNGYPQVRYRALVGNLSTLVVTTLARAPGRERDIGDQTSVQWSPDGRRTLISYTPADGEGEPVPNTAAQVQVRRSDGALEFAPPQSRGATQAVMSADGRKVYFRSSQGRRVWDAATKATSAVPGNPPVWFDPVASLDGRTIAYDTGATTAKVKVEVLDVRTGTRTQVGPSGRMHPVYADNRTIWIRSVVPCQPDCFYPVSPGPEVFAVDLRTGKERKLKLTSLQDVTLFYG